MLSEQEHGVKVHRQQAWPDAEYQTAAELLLPGPGDLPAPAEWQEVLPNLGAEPDVTAPTLLPEHAPKLCLLVCSSLLPATHGTGSWSRHSRESPMICGERSVT